mmetsp:Transcript_8313/g.21836  ORF Transcript_8313/g.21836 Transcript_8313/m.21836 type:complete len:340 (-) Transcript_8313:142-1161(-)
MFYTAAAFAVKAGEITASQRARFVNSVLRQVEKKFMFDEESMVITQLTQFILPVCEKDGIIDSVERERLTHQFTKKNVFADFRFVRLEEAVRLHSIQIAQMDSRINDVVNYSKAIDEKLCDFKKQYRAHLKRKTVVTVCSGLLSIIPLVGPALGKALDGIVDFSSVAEVLTSVTMLCGGAKGTIEKITAMGEYWAGRPLQAACKDHHLNAPQVATLGLLQLFDVARDGKALLELDVLDDAISTARVAAPSSKSKRASNIIEESSARGAPSESNVESMRDSLIGFLEFIVFGTFVFIPLVIILFIYLYRRKAKKANDIQEDEPDQASNLIRESPARGAPS